MEMYYHRVYVQEYCINNKERNIIRHVNICPATMQYLKCWLGEEVNFLFYSYFWENSGV